MYINFRSAKESDAKAVLDLYRRAAKKTTECGIDQWDELYPDMSDVTDDISEGCLFIGEQDGQIMSVYTLNRKWDEEYKNGLWKYPEESCAVIHRLCVDPKLWHLGIGRLTMQYIEKAAKDVGIKSLRLDVLSSNPYAVKLYKKLNYTIAGIAEYRKGKFYLMEKKIGKE